MPPPSSPKPGGPPSASARRITPEFRRAAEVRDELRSAESAQDWEAAQRALTRGLEEQRRELARLARDEARPPPPLLLPLPVPATVGSAAPGRVFARPGGYLVSLDCLRAGPGVLECRSFRVLRIRDIGVHYVST